MIVSFPILSLILKLKSPSLTLLVLVLSKIERLFTNGTVVIHLVKLMPYVILPVILPNLFSKLLEILSYIEHVKLFPIITFLVIFGIMPIISPTILLLHLSLFYFYQMAPIMPLLSLKRNSLLKLLLPTLLWMMQGIFLLFFQPL